MSNSNPLLKAVKASLLQMLSTHETENAESTEPGAQKPVVTDSNPHLTSFCQAIEELLRKGLHFTSRVGNTQVKDYWTWMKYIADADKERKSLSYAYIKSVTDVSENCKVHTVQGRGRLLLRHCLANRCLDQPVMAMVHHKLISPDEVYRNEDSPILLDENLGEVLISALRHCASIRFELDLPNCSFLDNTWILPVARVVEFVPCRKLGLCLGFVHGTAVVVGLEHDGVAAEDGKIEVGDVIDEINDRPVAGCSRPQLSKIVSNSSKTGPISVRIVKGCLGPDVFPPLLPVYQQLGVVLPHPGSGTERSRVLYIGSANIGSKGSADIIGPSIIKIVKTQNNPPHQSVSIYVGELGIKVTDQATGAVNQNHTFSEISSCGRQTQMPEYFAYVSGDTTCSLSSSFTCHVFKANSEALSRSILCAVAQGFKRTHYAV